MVDLYCTYANPLRVVLYLLGLEATTDSRSLMQSVRWGVVVWLLCEQEVSGSVPASVLVQSL